MSCAETKEEGKGDDVIVDLNGSTSSQFQETLDIITEDNSQANLLALANQHIKESVEMLLGCEEGDNSIGRYSSSISLVPTVLRDHCQEIFNPCVVSIGPMHHEEENLKGSEGWKRTCMCDLLDRLSCSPPKMLAACLRKVNESIQKIRRCYVGMRPYTDHELATMMVIDACFILQLLSLKHKHLSDLLWTQVSRDLLLVENQIPFFVLKDIFELTILKSEPSASLTNHMKTLLQVGHGYLFKEDIRIPKDLVDTIDHSDHILSLLQKCYHPEVTMTSKTHFLMCNVVKLERAGVSFKPNQHASKPNQDVSWPMAIEIEWSRFAWFSWFWVKPTLKIPSMIIQDYSEMILRNIIAYEQTASQAPYFTSYVAAIDDLVDSGHDIAKLVESQVIINYLGSNEEAANMINSVCKNTNSTTFYFEQVQQLETYYNGYWPRNIAWLRRTYFNNPWTIIALVATIILFALTITQTYFTINPRK